VRCPLCFLLGDSFEAVERESDKDTHREREREREREPRQKAEVLEGRRRERDEKEIIFYSERISTDSV